MMLEEKNISNELLDSTNNDSVILEYTETNEGSGISVKKINEETDENIDQKQLITEKL